MQNTAWMRYVILIGLSALAFLPLIVANGYFFPFITGKNFAFRIGVEIIFALWLVLMMKDASVRPRPLLIFYAFSAFVLSLFISAVLGENFDKSFWSNFERMEGWIGLFHLGLYFTVLTAFMRTEGFWKIFFNTTIVASAIVGFYSLLQLSGVFAINQGGVRVDATLGNATYLAVYMLFHFFFSAYAFQKWGTDMWLKVWYGFVMVLSLAILFYTATRGTILGLIAGIAFTALIIAVFGNSTSRLRTYSIGLIIGLLLVVGGFMLIKDSALVNSSDSLARLASISLSELETRFTVWGMAYEGFTERPIFGWGQENFNYVFNAYYEPSLYAQEPWFDRAHNVVLDWLIAGGMVGFLLYLSMYAIIAWYLIRPHPSFPLEERAILAGLIAGHAIHNLVVFDNLISYMFFLVVLAYIAYRARPDVQPFSHSEISQGVHAGVSGVIVVALFASLYFANMTGMAVASGLIDAIRPQSEGVSKNFELFQKLSNETDGLGRQEVREQIMQFALQVFRSDSGDQAFKSAVADFAISAMEDEIARNPNDARLRLFLGSFYRQVGRGEDAFTELSRALELSPEKPSILLELGVLFHDAGDMVSAKEWIRKAYELEPRYDLARSFYAVIGIETNDVALVNELLVPRYGTVTPDDGFILQAYLSKGDRAAVAGVLEERAKNNPMDPEVRLQLASAYLELGKRNEAIEVIREVIEIQPDFKAQGESFIQDIQAGRTPQ